MNLLRPQNNGGNPKVNAGHGYFTLNVGEKATFSCHSSVSEYLLGTMLFDGRRKRGEEDSQNDQDVAHAIKQGLPIVVRN